MIDMSTYLCKNNCTHINTLINIYLCSWNVFLKYKHKYKHIFIYYNNLCYFFALLEYAFLAYTNTPESLTQQGIHGKAS